MLGFLDPALVHLGARPGAATRAGAAAVVTLLAAAGLARAAEEPAAGTAIEDAVREYAVACALAAPSRRPSSVQAEVISAHPGSPALIDHAESPRLFAMAVDQALGEIDEATAVTFGLTAFGVAAARDSGWAIDPARYARGSALRRIGAAVTLAGPTQSGDSSAIRRPRNVTNHVTAELRLRLLGSRDRRDAAPDLTPAVSLAGLEDRVRALEQTEEFRARVSDEPGERGRHDAMLAALRAHPALARALLERLPEVTDTLARQVDRIDRSAVASLSLSADTYATGFGLDLYSATLIVELPRPCALTVNAAFRADEKVHGFRDCEFKLGLGTGWRWFLGSGAAAPLDVSVNGGAIGRNHERRPVWLANLKLDLPTRSGLKLTGAITSSRHPERVTESITRGSVGLSYAL